MFKISEYEKIPYNPQSSEPTPEALKHTKEDGTRHVPNRCLRPGASRLCGTTNPHKLGLGFKVSGRPGLGKARPICQNYIGMRIKEFEV